jgi:hypothetical protein
MSTPLQSPTPVRIFLSWAHQDRRWKEALLQDLIPALGMLRNVRIDWWEDSHLVCGEELTPGIVDRLDEADYGLLLLSTRFFGRPFILRHELPRFAGPTADKGCLPVALSPLPGFGRDWNLHGVERQVVFTHEDKSFAELSSVKRRVFANRLAGAIQRRIDGGNRYRSL